MGAADPSAVTSYHAHVYFDAGTREPARRIREAVEHAFPVQMGRWHEQPIGPHPRWSYQIAFPPERFARLVPWLMLHHEGLTVFIHPNTGDDLADHRDHALWIGESVPLDLTIFEKAGSG